MVTTPSQRLFLCYVPGLDRRRVDREHAPWIANQLAACPTARLSSVPSVELCSTIMTGAWPHEHGIWQAALCNQRPSRSLRQRFTDCLPDLVTTTGQCFIHQLTHSCDIPTLPPRRRREFELRRLKFRGRADTADLMAALGDHESLFRTLGSERATYQFTDRLRDRDSVLATACSGSQRLEVVQFHALDMMGHWYLKTDDEYRHFYGLIDDFVRRLYEKCRANGVTMVLLSDHGQERVTNTIDVRRCLRELDLPPDEYSYFVQAVSARFWFHTDRARQAIHDLVAGLPNGSGLTYRDFYEYGVRFPDAEYGELYFVPEPGTILFPDDFYHPLVNLFFGMKNWQERPRIRNRMHISSHGYLPQNDCEKGFMVVLDDRYSVTAPGMHLIDVAPSLLAMLGVEQPAAMTGANRFHRA